MASKTGTVQSSVDGQNNDAWMVGFTPSVSTAVWVGTDDNTPIKNSDGRPIYGRGVPGQIWQGYMNDALRGDPIEQFSDFRPIGTPPQTTPAAPPNQPGCVEGQPCPPENQDQGGDQGGGDQGQGDQGGFYGDQGGGDQGRPGRRPGSAATRTGRPGRRRAAQPAAANGGGDGGDGGGEGETAGIFGAAD